MIDVESVRRNYGIGPYEAGYPAPHYPLGGGIGAPHYDSHGVHALVHWNQQPPTIPNGSSSTPSAMSVKSDGDDDDDDDEDRPFTPPPPRERLSYTRYQLELLNGIYEEVRYPNSTQKQLIAKRVGITREQVKIWFQNRRRKDVIGNTSKGKTEKACDTSTSSTCSTGSSKDSDAQSSPVAVDGNESSSSEENSANNSLKDDMEPVVPNVVMKSVITELIKFKNDPLKGKKNKKKKSKKQKQKATVKKGLAATLLTGSYDMINPPNQVTPTAFFEKVRSGFNHSKNTSAFASPHESSKPTQISRISSSSESSMVSTSSNTGNIVPGTLKNSHSAFPFPGQGGHFLTSGLSGNFQHSLSTTGCDIPVLSDILSNKHTSIPSHMKDATPGKAAIRPPPGLPPNIQHREMEPRPPVPSTITPFASGRPLNGIYPYPFMAEQPMLLSTLRQQDHIFRPSAHYPVPFYSDDPYQPLYISSLSNPYFTAPPTSWASSDPAPHTTTPAYTDI